MEQIEGGCSERLERTIAVAGLVAGIGSMFGLIGLMIAGPTALGMAIRSAICAFK